MDNILKFISQGSIIIILSFFSLLSIVNQDVKILIYLVFLLFAYGITWGIAIIRPNNTIDQSLLSQCTLGMINFFPYLQPSLQSMFLSYTFVYTFLPMFYLTSINYGAISIFGLTYLINSLYNINTGCNNIIGVIMGTMIGSVTAILAFYLLKTQDLENLMYFSDDNKAEKCKIVNNNFKCEIVSKTA
tara:strand:- start:2090 stop:2653 length:564 start_codon:yes stop_codon:yes gene_type:complete